ncbi:MAG: hypothetical protein CVU55_06250 [Deltaproteobacteria bacterium HGW-Deltaproteobacteria-13]|jgi:hypothetical protein|nr:MAG: hypothetical protein CVU55_06250 [Deltaproteobacteria bacterium HGW-Deltaproteobacteria-13]
MNSITDKIKDIHASSQIKIIGILILMLSVIVPTAALAGWQVYYTGKAAGMFGYGGRGNFSTRAQCDAYISSSAGFERNNSYCSGFDAPSQKPSAPGSPAGDEGAAALEKEKKLQKEQQEREQELARQKMFAEEKDKLLGTLKGSGTGTLSGCIEKDRACVLNGKPCCAPYSCIGKFPNTYCGILRGSGTDKLELKTGTGLVNPQILKEQSDFENRNAEWMKKQKQLVEQRLKEPNKYAGAIYKSLKTNAPPPPWKTFNELQPGDVLLIEGSAIAYVDNKLSAGNNASKASHTVIYLKEVNGKKLFLDNQPHEGPRIISEEEFLRLYGHRGADVAKLAQPLNEKEGKQLFTAAVEMAQRNNKQLINKDTWFGKYLLTDTNYGAWGKNNVVCSESDWAIINATGRTIPHSDNILKLALGLNFSPSDFYNSKYFMVTPLW